jgi:hypothetical protein
MAGVIVFVAGVSLAAVAVAMWGVAPWRAARGRQW